MSEPRPALTNEAPAPPDGEERALAASVKGLVRADRQSRGQARDRVATGVVWSALRPWKGLQLLLHEVRYYYIGRSIDAAIADDGRVDFHDKDGVVASPLPLLDHFGPGGRPSSVSDGSASPGGRVRGTSVVSPGFGIADPGRLLRRRASHQDPHALERADFLERTRALREWLEARSRERNAERATRELLQKLARVWSADSALSATEQQEQTFAIWDACGEDGLGAQGRAAIVTYVNELARAHGQCPFPAATLARLNASRRSREAFEPCQPEAAAPRE